MNDGTNPLDGSHLNTRRIDVEKLRNMIPIFLKSKFSFAFVALRPTDSQAADWLKRITNNYTQKDTLVALLSVLKTRTSLRSPEELASPELAPHLQVLQNAIPPGPVTAMSDLLKKGLLPAGHPNTPRLPFGLVLETFAGQHSMKAAQLYELGVSILLRQ